MLGVPSALRRRERDLGDRQHSLCRSPACAASRYWRRLVDFASVEIPAAEAALAAVGVEFQLSGDLALGSGS